MGVFLFSRIEVDEGNREMVVPVAESHFRLSGQGFGQSAPRRRGKRIAANEKVLEDQIPFDSGLIDVRIHDGETVLSAEDQFPAKAINGRMENELVAAQSVFLVVATNQRALAVQAEKAVFRGHPEVAVAVIQDIGTSMERKVREAFDRMIF